MNLCAESDLKATDKDRIVGTRTLKISQGHELLDEDLSCAKNDQFRAHYIGLDIKSGEGFGQVDENQECPVNICINELFTATNGDELRNDKDYVELKKKIAEGDANLEAGSPKGFDDKCFHDNVIVRKIADNISPKRVCSTSESDENKLVLVEASFAHLEKPDWINYLASSKETAIKTWKPEESKTLPEEKNSGLGYSSFDTTSGHHSISLTHNHKSGKGNCIVVDLPAETNLTFTKVLDLKDRNSSVGDGHSAPCFHSIPHTKKSGGEDGLSCRICHSVSDLDSLVSPCLCTGSMKYVHESCLLNWLKNCVKTKCELCLHEVPVKKLVKPWSEWRFLDEKPVAIIWLVSFLILLTLNILSVIKDASRGCTSTTCIVFYALGCTGAVLGVIFLWFWAKKSAVYFRKLLTLNQVWFLEEKHSNSTENKKKTFSSNV